MTLRLMICVDDLLIDVCSRDLQRGLLVLDLSFLVGHVAVRRVVWLQVTSHVALVLK